MLYNEEKVKATSSQVLEAGTWQSGSTPSHHLCQHLLPADVKQCISYCAAADIQWQLLPVTAAAREVGSMTALEVPQHAELATISLYECHSLRGMKLTHGQGHEKTRNLRTDRGEL